MNLISLEFNTERLISLGIGNCLLPHFTDVGYLAHLALSSLFTDKAPKSFSVVHTSGDAVRLIAYTSETQDSLKQYASTFGDVRAYNACRWGTLVAKPVPAEFPAGLAVGFTATSCPVVRMASDGDRWTKGTEIDVYEQRRWRTGEDTNRYNVYEDWLRDELTRRGSVKLERAQVVRYERGRLVRRTHEKQRKSYEVKHPIVTFNGVFTVVDPAAFNVLLARGIGRHRTFGFGMILLRPA